MKLFSLCSNSPPIVARCASKTNLKTACGVGICWGKEENDKLLFLSNGGFDGEASKSVGETYRFSFRKDSIVTITLDCDLRKVTFYGESYESKSTQYLHVSNDSIERDEVVFYPCVRFGGYKGEKFQSI